MNGLDWNWRVCHCLFSLIKTTVIKPELNYDANQSKFRSWLKILTTTNITALMYVSTGQQQFIYFQLLGYWPVRVNITGTMWHSLDYANQPRLIHIKQSLLTSFRKTCVECIFNGYNLGFVVFYVVISKFLLLTWFKFWLTLVNVMPVSSRYLLLDWIDSKNVITNKEKHAFYIDWSWITINNWRRTAVAIQ